MAELREEMTQLLISMELYHQTHSSAEFNKWWDEEGRLKRYYDCKSRSRISCRSLRSWKRSIPGCAAAAFRSRTTLREKTGDG